MHIFAERKETDMKKMLLTVLLLLSALLAGAQSLTVISYNIRLGEAKDGTNSWPFRAAASRDMVMDQLPDIMGLQEAFLYQAAYLKEYCKGYKYVGVGREDGKKKGEIMAIFYRKETVKLLRWGTFWLSDTPKKPSNGWDAACKRTATWALMKDKRTGKKFYYVNTHLDHVGREAREKGLQLIVDRIAEMNKDSLPLVLTGDLNMTPERPEMAPLDRCMTSAREAAYKTDHLATFHGWGKLDKDIIDYIYYSGFSSCVEYETVRKGYADRKFISDHYPIKAVLVF